MLNIGYRPIRKKKVSKACCFFLFFLYTLISVCRSVVNGESPLSLKLFTKLTDWEQRLTGSEDNDPPECLFFFNINVVSFLFWGAVLGPHCWNKLISSCAGWAYCSGFSCCGRRPLTCGSQALENRLNCTGWVALRHAGSPCTRPAHGIKPMSPVLTGRVFTTEPSRKPFLHLQPTFPKEQFPYSYPLLRIHKKSSWEERRFS